MSLDKFNTTPSPLQVVEKVNDVIDALDAGSFDGYWEAGESVQVGDIRYVEGRDNVGYILECVQAGTTGSSAPTVSDEDIDSESGSSDGSSVSVSVLLDLCYPVGSLYWSKKSTNPSQLFGGTWTQIKDKFILAAGTTYAVNSTGGAATVTLTTNQIPSHTHTGSATSATTTDHYHAFGYNTANNGGTFIATSDSTDYNLIPSSGTRGWNGSGGGGGYNGDATTFSANMITSKSVATSGSTDSHAHTVSISNSGGGQAHNNMPPYVTYYCWERTA